MEGIRIPLKAILDNEPRYAWNLNEKHRGARFKCPICSDDMLLVLPQENIIKHFRHKNEEAHGEPESPEHLAMKQWIYEQSIIINQKHKNDVWKPCLEYPLYIDKTLVNIIDVLLTIETSDTKTFYGFECQCSSINSKEFVSRNKHFYEIMDKYWDGYLIWILGNKYYHNTNKFRWHYRPRYNTKYKIQRISHIERFLPRVGQHLNIYYDYNTNTMCYGKFKHREKALTLGWYTMFHAPNLEGIIQDYHNTQTQFWRENL